MLQAGEKETEKLPALESEKTLPTQVHELDERIEFLKKEIDNLKIQMAEVMNMRSCSELLRHL